MVRHLRVMLLTTCAGSLGCTNSGVITSGGPGDVILTREDGDSRPDADSGDAAGDVDAGDDGLPQGDADPGDAAGDAGLPLGDADPEPECAATDGARCYYVAPDGSDAASGSIDQPFKTFRPALVLAAPGDFVYARGGLYGHDNAMVGGVYRHLDTAGATTCPPGQTLASGYCFSDKYVFLKIGDFSGWASETTGYTIRSGEEGRPITVRAFPGERPVLDTSGFSQYAVSVTLKHHWTIAGFDIVGGMVNISGGTAEAQTHDIIIRGNNIHDIVVDGGDNPGIVRIDRGDIGGPFNIYVVDNELHGLYDIEKPGEWEHVPDEQHFGAVTTLSREHYLGFDGGGTGYIEIRGNHIHHCPQAFFFKNPMAGPIEIDGNLIHHTGSVGDLTCSNVHMIGNVLYAVDSGWWAVGGGELYDDPRMNLITGSNARIEYNTFVGLNSLLELRSGRDHVVDHNVVFGLHGRVAGANFDTPAFVIKSGTFPDALEPADSLLHTIESDNNCLVSPFSDFQLAMRRLPPESTGESKTRIESWGYDDGSVTFGIDLHSVIVIEDDAEAIFLDPANHDYRLSPTSPCSGMGHTAR